MSPRDIRIQRFTQTQRLKRPSEYTHVMADAERSADRYFTVLSRRRENLPARLGLAVSKKAARRAVDRNRIKRLAREAFRHCAARGPHDVVVFARHAAAATAAAVLRSSLERHFRRLLCAEGRQ